MELLLKLLRHVSESSWAWAVCSLILYFLFAGLFYTNVEGWTWLEAMYFAMVTMSTVGFGDLYPSVWYSQMVTVFFILIGISVVFAQLGNCVTSIIEPTFRFWRSIFERFVPDQYIDISGDNIPAFQVPRTPFIFYSKKLAGPIVILLVFQLVSAAIFVRVEPEVFDFGTAFWYVMVTATTVGYGDISAESTAGRIWAILHILLSVCLLAALIGDFGNLYEERKGLVERAYHFTRSYDEEVLAALDEDGNKIVGKHEFILGMLKETGKLDQKEDIAPLEALYIKLLSVQSGTSAGAAADQLDLSRLRQGTKQETAQMSKHMQASLEAIRQSVGKEIDSLGSKKKEKKRRQSQQGLTGVTGGGLHPGRVVPATLVEDQAEATMADDDKEMLS
ncbi:TPKA [Symbiodinium microadriaticum]|nr:TPKA [Symbiodinium microadriaticum]